MANASQASSLEAPEEDVAEDEVPTDCISPSPDVFSYFMLTAPTERIKHNAFTPDACMSYLLVVLVLIMQGTLLFCVYEKVIVRNTNWHQGIMKVEQEDILNTGNDWDLMGTRKPGCNDGRSLCTMENGTFTCAPPSVQLIGRWDELDTDKDGTWTLQEAKDAREDLKCKYAVDPIEVFGSLSALLQERKELIWLHPDVKAGSCIPKTYFTYIMGDMALCSYRNQDMCGNLVKRGVFDAALQHGTVPRVGTSLRSALAYCRSLLDEGGLCERILPSTYATWKIESEQECLEPKYKKFVYTEPHTGRVKSLLEVDYEARENYEMAKSRIFKAYKLSILFLWMLLNVSQVREVFKTICWVVQLPILSKEDEASLDASTPRTHATYTMSIPHRLMLITITSLRIMMLFLLLYVGVHFLGRQTDYIGLLLDGVALVFIVEVEEIIYARVLRQEVRSSWETRESIELNKVGVGFMTKRPDIMDMIWLGVVACMAFAFLTWYTNIRVEPLYQALQCTCLSQGEKCREESTFSTSFWDQYWTKDVPSAIQSINALKESFGSTKHRAVNLLKYHHSHFHLG